MVVVDNPILAQELTELDEDQDQSAEVDDARVSADLFETPLQALGASGGTAAFFRVRYREGEWQIGTVDGGAAVDSPDFWIGKDLARARDELDFYMAARKQRRVEGWEALHWMTPCGGVVIAPTNLESGDDDTGEREILLLRNARDSYAKCRMLDIKIGEVTAVGGWQGKGYFMAWTQKWLDGVTNSSGQGFRLEGFDNPPESMQSILEHVQAEALVLKPEKIQRIVMQRQQAIEFLKFFTDLHTSGLFTRPPVPDADELSERLSEVETEELVLLQCIEELAGLVAACRRMPVAQQWIGSSVMLAFDAELRPLRTELREAERMPSGGAALIAKARVHIFDWGRSELNTAALNSSLWWETKQNREHYWGLYCTGIALLLYDCCLIYVRRFFRRQQAVAFSYWDRNIYTEDGMCGLSVQPLSTLPKHDNNAKPSTTPCTTALEAVSGKRQKLKVTWSVAPLPLPEPTRLEHAWCVTVHRAMDAPKLDIYSQSDGMINLQSFCEPVREVQEGIRARKRGRNRQFDTAQSVLKGPGSYSTTGKISQRNPVWEETFQLATLKPAARAPFIEALLVAFAGDGGLELDPECSAEEQAMGRRFIEKRQSIYPEHQVVELQRVALCDLLPISFTEGLGSANYARQNQFMHWCFPELSRAGKLGTAERSQIKTARELWTCVIMLVLVLAGLAELLNVQFIADGDEAEAAAVLVVADADGMHRRGDINGSWLEGELP